MNLTKKQKWVGVIVVVVLVVAAVLWSQSVSDQDAIKIGYIGPLTGDVAVLGSEASKAIQLAVDEVNSRGGIGGMRVKLYIEDDQYDTAQSISAYEKLVNSNNVEVVIMSTYGGFMALAERAVEDNVLLVDSLDCDEDIAALEDVFCVAKETRDLANVIADFALSQGYRRIGVLHGTTDNFMGSVANMFDERVGSRASVQIESYPPSTRDFKTQLEKLRGSDALVYLGYDEIGIAIRQAAQLGLDQPVLTIPSVATTPSIQEAAGEAIDGIYFSFYVPQEDNEIAAVFHERFAEEYDEGPLVFVASDHAYDAANIVLTEVLPRVSAETKPMRFSQAVKAMYDVDDYDGVSGTLSMQGDGRIDGIDIELYQLQDMVPVRIEN